MVRHPLRALVALSIALASIGVSSTPVRALPGIWIGAGYASQSVGGDFNGTNDFLNSAQDELIVAGKVQDGSGLALDIGYGINPYLAAEGMLVSTRHTATSSVIFPKLDTTANVTGALFGFRGTYPVADGKAELFARGMLSVYAIDFADYDLKGSVQGNQFVYTSTDRVTFNGTGLSAGLGAEALFGNLGVSAGYTYSSVNFTSASSGGGSSGTLSKTLNAPIGLVDVLVTYHFGAPVKQEEKQEQK